jgi:intein/homing endonuclease
MYFFEPTHTYYKNFLGDYDYISGSGVVKIVENEYDSIYWSLYKAYEFLLYRKNIDKTIGIDTFLETKPEASKLLFKNYKRPYKSLDYRLFDHLRMFADESKAKLIQKYILKSWKKTNKDSLNKGSSYHDEREQAALNAEFAKNPFTKNILPIIKNNEWIDVHTNQSIIDLNNIEPGYYPEMILHYDMFCGRADKVWFEDIGRDKLGFWIDDYKGLSLDTPIATTLGWKTIETLNKSDIIFDGNGLPTNILNISDIHNNPCYEITLDTNDKIVADHEHKWVITRRNYLGNYYDIEMTTDNLFNYLQMTKSNKKRDPLRIKCTNSLQLPDVNLPIDPYVLGVWLADGNSHVNTISNPDQRIWDEILKRGYLISENHSKNNNKCRSHTIFGIHKYLKELNLLRNKHIPDIYLRSSETQRLNLLRGFMDGDGYFNKLRKRAVMNTTNPLQAENLSELASSLGFKPTIIKTKTSGFGKSNIDTWNICFSPNINPFLIRNNEYTNVISKVKKPNSLIKNYRYITTINPIKTVPTKCLEVDSPSHTYLAGKNLIKTHNTNKALNFDNEYQNLKYPLSHLADCNWNHYRIQLSFYIWILIQYGYHYMGSKLTHCVQNPDDLTWKRTGYHFDYLKHEMDTITEHIKQYFLHIK